MSRTSRAKIPSIRRKLTSPWRLAALLACGALVIGTPHQLSAQARPKAAAKGLDHAAAQRFVLDLINRDRKKAGLPPVVLDDAASSAGLRHARDMATKGFTGHIGSDGSTPEQRYSESGGSDFVQENSACLFDTVERTLDPKPRFDATKLAALHEMFMAEVPPNDGHRRNILNPLHNRVGIGVAQPQDVPQPCLTQEFVDDYGNYDPLPREGKGTLRVKGTISAPLLFGGVGLGRTPLPQPPARERLNGKLYRIPAADTMYFPAGFKTPKPVKLTGQEFSIDLDLGKKPRPGSYAVSIWAKNPGSSQLFMISLRTLTVR
ncbi:MAG: CAP domain-containing protein [Myxococcota bacterium]